MVQTIVHEVYESETLTFRNSLFEKDYVFEVCGQTVDRSYEDRSVYFDFTEGQRGWLDGEQAIALGQALIKHGTKALMANMINHQAIHQMNLLRKYIRERRVSKLIMEMVDDHPVNYGGGFHTFLIKPVWKKRFLGSSKAPEYNEDFCMETVIYWSPIAEEFKDQLKRWGCPIEFVNYNHSKTIAEFQVLVESYSGEELQPDSPKTDK